jgi:hypothetical protein
MLFNLKTYNTGPKSKQVVVRVLNRPILFGVSEFQWYFRIGNPGIGLEVTSNPNFSVRNKFKKSIKIGKYYISKL